MKAPHITIYWHNGLGLTLQSGVTGKVVFAIYRSKLL